MQPRVSNLNVFQTLSTQIQRLPSSVQAGLLVVVYVLAGLVLNRFAAAFESSWNITPWHPTSGLHFALLLGFGLRYTPALLLVPLLDGLVIPPVEKTSVLSIVLLSLWTMVCYGGASAVMLRQLRIDPRLRQFRDVIWFVLFGAFIVPLAVALLSVTTLTLSRQVEGFPWQARVLSDWAGGATGIAMVAPLLLVLLRDNPFKPSTLTANLPPPAIKVGWHSHRRMMGLSLEVLALAAAIWVAYGTAPAKSLDYTYFIFIPLTWIAVWHGFARVTLAILLLNVGVVLFVHSDLGVNRPLALQFCLMAVSYTSLLLGAVISDRLRAKEQLRYNSLHDSLTGLANRSLFLNQLGAAVDRAKPPHNCLSAVLFLDFDRFKAVNDSLGHSLGDQLLIHAHRAETHLRPQDTAARLGGDEFGFLLEDIQGADQAVQVAKQIQQDLTRAFDLDGHQVFMNASIGIALSANAREQPEELFRQADIALLRAKRRASNRYALFDITMQQQTVKLLQLENELRQGLARQEFQVYYQPIVSLKTGQVSGFEALIRWQHPTRGMIAPSQFLPAAEETGLIVPMGQWVLEVACRQIKAWQLTFSNSPLLTMAVNLAGKQFLQPDLVTQVEQVLQETELEGRYLTLEITEGIVVENPAEAAIALQQVQALGVQLSIDDFGTGYSSLSRLHHFPISTLKIDRSFISQMGAGGENSKLVQSIVSLAHSLEMQVVAEGIESAAQLTKLKILGCDQGQGYFLSRPLSSQAAESLLVTGPQW